LENQFILLIITKNIPRHLTALRTVNRGYYFPHIPHLMKQIVPSEALVGPVFPAVNKWHNSFSGHYYPRKGNEKTKIFVKKLILTSDQ